MNLFDSKGKLFKRQKLQLYRDQNYPKMSPDRIHKLFKEVDLLSNRLSPSNCSKNLFAIKSNIDEEIESAKNKASKSSILTSRTHGGSLTPSKPRILPKLEFTPSKIFTFQDLSISEMESNTLIEKDLKKSKSKRLNRINKVIFQCSGLKKRMSSEKSSLKLSIKLTPKSFEIQEKNAENKIVERCQKHFESLDQDNEDSVKLTNVLKRGKKIWKQNHLSFIKRIDHVLNSIKHLNSKVL